MSRSRAVCPLGLSGESGPGGASHRMVRRIDAPPTAWRAGGPLGMHTRSDGLPPAPLSESARRPAAGVSAPPGHPVHPSDPGHLGGAQPGELSLRSSTGAAPPVLLQQPRGQKGESPRSSLTPDRAWNEDPRHQRETSALCSTKVSSMSRS